jgi:hypothetical protein
MAKGSTKKKIPLPVDDLEMRFWGNCANSFGEETKQILYMKLMGFPIVPTWRSPINFVFGGRSVIDIGGGPCSVLLKGLEVAHGVVVDPGDYPTWVTDRYKAAGIDHNRAAGEAIAKVYNGFDLALIYNCLQHCESPEKIIASARAIAKELRMFEWINIPAHEGHPHCLTAADLNRWAGREGRVVGLNGESGCLGAAWVLA